MVAEQAKAELELEWWWGDVGMKKGEVENKRMSRGCGGGGG